MQTIDLTKNLSAQDMINIIMRDKKLSAGESILYAINKDICKHIIQTGYASIALGLWGHDDYERKWDILEEPIVKVEFDELKLQLIKDIMEKESVDFDTAISYYLLFTMDALGYHI